MKAKDLMIGDWVASRKWIEKPFKLITLSERKGDFFYGRTSENSIVGPFFVESFEPIPLTPEILEKNGFGYIEKSFGLTHFYLGEKYFCKNMDLHIGTDNKGNFWITTANNTIYGLHYVHEFQHALRLSGIEKEIVL